MSTNHSPAASPMPLTTIDWQKLARDAFGAGWVAGFVGGTLHTVAKMLEGKNVTHGSSPHLHQQAIEVDDKAHDEVAEAAGLLGVSADATQDEIRAALRTRLASSQLHPDHGGDGVEATKLIAAKNLLVERLRGQP